MSYISFVRGSLACLVIASGLSASAQLNTTVLSSVSTSGAQGDFDSWDCAFSDDGLLVAFSSFATTLVAGDSNFKYDIFVRDLAAGTTARVSLTNGGAQADGNCRYPAVSRNGRYIAFQSAATNLVAGDTNDQEDIYLRDRNAGTTRRISVSQFGGNPDDGCYYPEISEDGRYVAYYSYATNIVPGDLNGAPDVFVYDSQLMVTRRVSVPSGGGEGDGYCQPYLDISGNGNRVAFCSESTNLIPADLNGMADVFVHDIPAGTTTRVSVDSGNNEATLNSYEVKLNWNGRIAAFGSLAPLVFGDTNDDWDVYVRNLDAGTVERVSLSTGGAQPNLGAFLNDFSRDARYVAMESTADTLVTGDTNDTRDVFVRDRANSTTTRLNVSTAGVQSNGNANFSSLSPDGTVFGYDSDGTNLVTGDSNADRDVFARRFNVKVTANVFDADYVGDYAWRDLTIELITPGGIIVESIPGVPLASNGIFSFNTRQQGTFTISVNGLTWLRSLKPGVVIGPSNLSAGTFVLTNGDSDGSGEVDAVDIDRIIANFGALTSPNDNASTEAVSGDLDGSGEVDAVDIDIAIARFGSLDD